MDYRHIAIERLVANMLDQATLTEKESEHLAGWEKCISKMIDASRERLQKGPFWEVLQT